MAEISRNMIMTTQSFITAFIYRPITIQMVVQIMIANQKGLIETVEYMNTPGTTVAEREELNNSGYTENRERQSIIPSKCNNLQMYQQICYATKCQLLKAKGIIRRLCSVQIMVTCVLDASMNVRDIRR